MSSFVSHEVKMVFHLRWKFFFTIVFALFIQSGVGIDEKAIISLVGESHPEHRQNFRKGCRDFFIEDERSFERWDDHRVKLLKHEFMRFKVYF